MRERATALAVAIGLVVLGVACSGGAEKNVVKQYFNALAANDTNTLTSFAAVAFQEEVESYKVVSVSEETRGPAPLPDLVAQQQNLEAVVKTCTFEAAEKMSNAASKVASFVADDATVDSFLDGIKVLGKYSAAGLLEAKRTLATAALENEKYFF